MAQGEGSGLGAIFFKGVTIPGANTGETCIGLLDDNTIITTHIFQKYDYVLMDWKLHAFEIKTLLKCLGESPLIA